jgi:predicted RNase H-like nuclease
VFLTPPRAEIEASTHAVTTAASVRSTGFGVSQQSVAPTPRIREVDEWDQYAPCRVYEVHPEISFAVLLGAPASAPKNSWAGMSERRRALEWGELTLEHIDGDAAVRAAVDDVLDAPVAAWSARRIARGQAMKVPDPAPAGRRDAPSQSGPDRLS